MPTPTVHHAAPPPPRRPRTPRIEDSFAAPRAKAALAAIISLGLATDLVVRTGFATAAGVFFVLLASTATIWVARLNRAMSVALLAAPLFAVFSMLRASETLHAFNAVAIVGLFTYVLALGPHGRPFALTLSALLTRIGESIPVLAATHRGIVALARQLGLTRIEGGRARSVIQGVVLATPILLLLRWLLVSADAVFGSLVNVPVDAPGALGHVTLIVIGAFIAAAILGRAADQSDRGTTVLERKLGRTEALVVVVGLVALLGVFDVIQLVTALGGADHIIETAGLTRAEYARSGFFQLIWVAGIVITVVLSIRAAVQCDAFGLADRQTRRIIRLSQASLVACLPIVGISIQRLFLYADAFGWTMQRITACFIAGWVASVLALLTAQLQRQLGQGQWFYSAAGISGLMFIAALNVINPEAVIVRSNVAAGVEKAELDTAYLGRLSADAVPAMVDQIRTREPQLSENLRFALCWQQDGSYGSASHLGLGWNASTQRAQALRSEMC